MKKGPFDNRLYGGRPRSNSFKEFLTGQNSRPGATSRALTEHQLEQVPKIYAMFTQALGLPSEYCHSISKQQMTSLAYTLSEEIASEQTGYVKKGYEEQGLQEITSYQKERVQSFVDQLGIKLLIVDSKYCDVNEQDAMRDINQKKWAYKEFFADNDINDPNDIARAYEMACKFKVFFGYDYPEEKIFDSLRKEFNLDRDLSQPLQNDTDPKNASSLAPQEKTDIFSKMYEKIFEAQSEVKPSDNSPVASGSAHDSEAAYSGPGKKN